LDKRQFLDSTVEGIIIFLIECVQLSLLYDIAVNDENNSNCGGGYFTNNPLGMGIQGKGKMFKAYLRRNESYLQLIEYLSFRFFYLKIKVFLYSFLTIHPTGPMNVTRKWVFVTRKKSHKNAVLTKHECGLIQHENS
jgi:hypothetical protein